MKKLKLYIETSVWNHLFADDAPEKKAVTEELFARIKFEKHEIFISRTVTAEIDNASEEKRKRLLSVIDEYSPVRLEIDEYTVELARFYIENGLLSEDHLDDLLHLASATVNNLQILVSWNLKHLVKHKTRILANSVNMKLGYREIDICRPEEVLEIGE
ncbi:MAG: PIN domain nuclease [bacterium]